ncbi:MBL fold metallo-hydrolase [Myroides sp. DW712]|uniref:MBL fold metallo-hydrolase n=1 Tax=Myroides sp. DW712 TaxID=3389800 RepID=UPI0039780870
MKVHHLNCVEIQSPTGDRAIGHCVLLETPEKLILLDAGISSIDLAQPTLHFSETLLKEVGFNFEITRSAKEQINNLGLDPTRVTDIVLTHLDCDHSSGLLDFPQATVHVGMEEWTSFTQEEPRYLPFVLQHQPKVRQYTTSQTTWWGLEARRLSLHPALKIALIPLFGHTLGHCGIAFEVNDKAYFYIGDAYYLRVELTDSTHPIHELTKARAADNEQRIQTLTRLMAFVKAHPEVNTFGYHDYSEMDN